MFIKKVLSWLRDSLVGLGCSLLAAGFVGIITPGTYPPSIAICLVVGNLLLALSFVVSLIKD